MCHRSAVAPACSCVALVLAAFALGAVADAAGPTVTLFAGVASATGVNDTAWRSEATFWNGGAAPADVLLEIVPRGETEVVASTTLTLAAGETRRFADLYAALQAPSGAGTLRVTGNVVAWVRTFNQGSSGTFGQDVPPATAFSAGAPVLFPISTPADVKAEFRSNLLLLNLETTAVTFTLASGATSKTYDVPAGVFAQISGIGAFLGLSPGRTMLTVTATGKWSGMVATVDPVLGDPTTVRGLVATTRSVTQFSGVASAPGVNGTEWHSEATLYNPRTSPQSVTLELVPRGESDVASRTTLALAPLELRRLADVYTALGAASGAGTLRVTGDVLTWIRTFNQGAGATFGQDVPGVVPGVGFGPQAVVSFPVSMPATVAADFRSNFLVFNHESRTITCTLAAGPVSRRLDVPAGAFLQQNNVGAWLGLLPGVSTVSVTANGRWTGMVATIDPVLGDPTTMVGVRTTGNPAPTARGTPAGSAVTTTIGAAGGTLTSPDGRLALFVPSGALAAPTTFSIQPVTNLAWSGIGTAYRLGPDGTTFAKPATLTFTATAADSANVSAEGLTMGYQDAEGYWRWLSTAATNPAARTVSAAITKIAASGAASSAPSFAGSIPAERGTLEGDSWPTYSLLSGLVLDPLDAFVKTGRRLGFNLFECLPAKVSPLEPNPLEPLLFGCEAFFNTASGSKTWAVNGVVGGNATFGEIQARDNLSAIFSAPKDAPNPRTVTVSVKVSQYQTYQNLTVLAHVTIGGSLYGEFDLTLRRKDGLQVHAKGVAELQPFKSDENGIAYGIDGTIEIDKSFSYHGSTCSVGESAQKAIPADAVFSIQKTPSLAQHWVLPAVSWNFVCTPGGFTMPVSIQFFVSQAGDCSQAVWLPLSDETHPKGSFTDACNRAWTVDGNWDFY